MVVLPGNTCKITNPIWQFRKTTMLLWKVCYDIVRALVECNKFSCYLTFQNKEYFTLRRKKNDRTI